ncbi:MAG: hypothetical protein FJ147_02990 [Deltaproteobacteria bacterium]|nr:hypothetical protein [Deltaproteobacteria bacterium]
MKKLSAFIIAMTTMIVVNGASPAAAQGQEKTRYEIVVTNLTRGQRFTPPFVVIHKPGVRLFTLGMGKN